jgi:DNA-damage-inducible protein D
MTTPPMPRISPFDAIKQVDEAGNEYWSARDLGRLLTYKRWDRFEQVITKAQEACERSGNPLEHHFSKMGKVIEGGRWGGYTVTDYHLSRYACYLVVQNADPAKEIVALGQTYFAVQTRRQELGELSEAEEARLRIEEREKILEHNRDLAAQARLAGHVTAQDFAVFQDHGYRGLYNGESAREIHARKGLTKSQHILDFMGSTELAANSFRAALAREMLARDQVSDKDAANRTHHVAGRLVRHTMEEAGVPMPEELPTPAKSYQQVKREVEEHERRALEDRYGLWGEPGSGADGSNTDDDGSTRGL